MGSIARRAVLPTMHLRLPLTLLVAASTAASTAAQQPTDSPGPWRLARALDAAPWVEVHGEIQTRYESMSNRLRRGETGSNQGFFNRVTTQVTLRDRFLAVSAEVADMRLFDEPADATPTNGQINTIDLLQGYVSGTFRGAFEPGDTLYVVAGRQTMDLGSRRLVARNIYRNTINAFTGVNGLWTGREGNTLRAFAVLPVQRLPGNSDRQGLLDGDPRFDQERAGVRFWGLVGGVPEALLGADFEPYYYGLHEEDSSDLATADRHLATFGARLNRNPSRGALHFELESAWQTGTRGTTTASGAPNLDHVAYFHHVSAGYTFDHETRPRADLVFDMASGDKDPGDDEDNRFDTLFGVPRPDYGPTGLYRAVDRANLVSPGVRFVVKPTANTEVMLLQRFNYLASDRDAWTNGYVDPTGRSGSHIGDTSEIRIRYDVLPGGLRLECGAAYFAAGTFAESAPGAGAPNDAVFGYLQTSLWF